MIRDIIDERIICSVPKNQFLAMEFSYCKNYKHIKVMINGLEKEIRKEQAKEIFSKIKNRITNGKSYADIEKEYRKEWN